MNESVLSMLSDRLAGGGQVLCAWVTMNEPAVAETLAREAFDAVVLDMQHGACRQTDYRSRADRRILRGCATLGRVRQIPAARAAILGSARCDQEHSRKVRPPMPLIPIVFPGNLSALSIFAPFVWKPTAAGPRAVY